MFNSIKNSLRSLLEKTDDKERIEEISKIESEVERAEKEHEEELKKFADLKKDYRDLVINSKFPKSESKPDEPKAPSEDHKDETSFEGKLDEAIKNILEKPKE